MTAQRQRKAMNLIVNGPLPRRKRKPKATPFDSFEPFLRLRSMILNGTLKPGQQVGILFDHNDSENLDMKFPWRTCTDRLRKLFRETGIGAEYRVVKYETDTPGVWFVRVERKSPAVEKVKKPRTA